MNQKEALLKFWGVRGSIASGSSSFGSHTSCIEIDFQNGHSIFFDAGTGIREASKGREFERVSLFLSHFHWDHIQGLPFFTPLVKGSSSVELFTGFDDAEERLRVLFDSRFHPVDIDQYRSTLTVKELKESKTYTIEGLQIETAALNHPGQSYAFKLSSDHTSFCYATDSDYDPLPSAAANLLGDSDWAVLDSQFLIGDSIAKADYGHASFKEAIDVAAKAQIKNCILFHFDPNYSDAELTTLESQAQDYARTKYNRQPLKVWMAKEGQSIPLVF